MLKRLYCILVFCAVIFTANFTEASSYNVNGIFSGGVYTNRNLGIKAAFDNQKWNVLSRQDINRIYKNNPQNNSTLIFSAAAKDQTSSMNISYSDLGVMLSNLSESERKKVVDVVLDLFKDYWKDYLIAVYVEALGGAVSPDEIDIKINLQDVKFIGSKYKGFDIRGTIKTMPIYQKAVMMLKDDKCYTIVATSSFFNITDNLLKMFRKVR